MSCDFWFCTIGNCRIISLMFVEHFHISCFCVLWVVFSGFVSLGIVKLLVSCLELPWRLVKCEFAVSDFWSCVFRKCEIVSLMFVEHL